MSKQMGQYVVGIDLGTTNTAVAYADIREPEAEVRTLPLLQLVAEGEVAERRTLPSYLYIGGGAELPPGALGLPWDPQRSYAVGEFARRQGARVPSRLVSSAKSWLCHGGVDREAAILPWGSPPDVPKISPVEASARYLSHVREVWNERFPHAPLEHQQVVLTVPASFDEVARELTWSAAERSGLSNVVLLEEPQAALYAWLDVHRADREGILAGVGSILVVDVGGGTTDFSLVAVRWQGERLGLERIAVGDHILLGGDNIDMALARVLEQTWGERLDTQRFFALVQQCRVAKETLLGEESAPAYRVSLPGRGRSVIAGALSAQLDRDRVIQDLLDGFFPLVDLGTEVQVDSGAAVGEWGLPFAADPAVSKHLAAFLRKHVGENQEAPWPDAILFNGGALKPSVIRERLVELLVGWTGKRVRVLESVDLDLAVARGAAYYGLARAGKGIRIGGGAARTYYLAVERAASATPSLQALCVVPKGMEEGEEHELTNAPLTLIANRAVSFPLFASSTRTGDAAGALVDLQRNEVSALPPIRTVLRFGKKLETRELPVHLAVRLTEVGTLELWCVSRSTPHRWRLQFDLRDSNLPAAEEPKTEGELATSAEQTAEALQRLRSVFPTQGGGGGDPVRLVRAMEEILGSGKDAWPLAFLRDAWEALWEGREARKRSPEHEARWYNLAGFFLRPGFGTSGDAVRVDRLWRLRSEGIRFPKAAQVRAEWWSMWKRIAGGLQRAQQQQIFQEISPYLLPRLQKKREKLPRIGPQEIREYWQLLASCELLQPAQKAELGDALLALIARGKATPLELWSLGRLGARQPMYGPLNCVVPATKASDWVRTLLDLRWDHAEAYALAVLQLARRVGDRERDLPEELREQVAQKLQAAARDKRMAKLVREVHPIERAERARILDETLPIGLVWRDSPAAES
ncbi:MAG: heat-shock protein [Candidatus Binatia bacterium]|nr:MAG: heat-shock protein [Candidatus Binatia bacterium]